MTESDIKLEIFRTVDDLTGTELNQVYQLLMEVVNSSHTRTVEDEDAAYQEMAEDEEKGIRRFDEVEEWDFLSETLEDNEEEYGGYLSTLSKEEYAKLEADYEEMAEDERTGKRNLDW